MLFLLKFANDEEDNNFFLNFKKINYYEDVNAVDITFKFDNRQHQKDVMRVYSRLIENEKDGVLSLLVRDGGAGFRGRVYIYPTEQNINAKMHINSTD